MADYQVKTISLAQIINDMSINPRDDIDKWTVERYAGIIETMPEMEVFNVPGVGYLLAAGFHRYRAHVLLGTEKVRVKVYIGTREEAQEFADKSNAKNPLQLKPEELCKLAERVLLRDPYVSDDVIVKEYGVPRGMIEAARKKFNWGNGSFPQMRGAELEEPDIFPTIDPRDKERPWWELHFSEERRKTTLEERVAGCQICEWAICQRAHLLDWATWGENEQTYYLCVRCHELFDLMLKSIEKRGERAGVLLKRVQDKLGDGKSLEALWQLANDIAQVRRVLLELRNKRFEHLARGRTNGK
jgi:hypothetical protein